MRHSVLIPLIVTLIALPLLLQIMPGLAAADEFNYDEDKVPHFTLPELLVCSDGTAVTTSEQWMLQRRPEILRLFEEHVFGKSPGNVSSLRTRVRSDVSDAVNGTARRRELTIFFSDDDAGPRMDLMVYTPINASGPVPTFLGYNFQGNHTVEADPRIHVTESWVRNNKDTGVNDNRAREESRGAASSRWAISSIIEAGFGLATIYYGDVDPDFDDGFRNGIHQLLEQDPDNRPADAGGSISAWSWGLSRALDVLETDPAVDGQRVAVFGHSRLGKTSLWAGATDQRFAMVISNDSGCGGAALSRRRFGETVARINTSFPHWFCRRHRDYNNNEDALPIDHHMLIALAAPRPVYVASAEDDRWADPHGEFLSLFHGGPAWRLFGKTPLANDTMPAVNSPLMTDVGYHIRTGKHDVTDYDWEQYIRFATTHLSNQPASR
ncbi:MAG: acetylxylan esterase [Planctomycetaceae bacterium]|nr:acetylxylan esterase [Planctomycetaceae bacterium]